MTHKSVANRPAFRELSQVLLKNVERVLYGILEQDSGFLNETRGPAEHSLIRHKYIEDRWGKFYVIDRCYWL